tara:strand:- start:265 stop:492 length:228 start_codon:yes stop_codon:yes gene_type:complete
METKQWYEIAVSWKDDGGTQTIECMDNLNQAMDYARTCSELKESDVDFVFIDKWYTPDFIDNYMCEEFEAIIINK